MKELLNMLVSFMFCCAHQGMAVIQKLLGILTNKILYEGYI